MRPGSGGWRLISCTHAWFMAWNLVHNYWNCQDWGWQRCFLSLGGCFKMPCCAWGWEARWWGFLPIASTLPSPRGGPLLWWGERSWTEAGFSPKARILFAASQSSPFELAFQWVLSYGSLAAVRQQDVWDYCWTSRFGDCILPALL